MKLIIFLLVLLCSTPAFSLEIGERPDTYRAVSFLEMVTDGDELNGVVVKVSAYIELSKNNFGHLFFSDSSLSDRVITDSFYLDTTALNLSAQCISKIYGKRLYVYGKYIDLKRTNTDRRDGQMVIDSDQPMGGIESVQYIESESISDDGACDLKK